MASAQKITLFTLCLATLALTATAGELKVVLRAERDYYGSLEQQALVFEETKVVLTRNSGFLCAGARPTQLGVFHAKYDSDLKSTQAQMIQIALRLENRPPTRLPPGRPHGLRFFIGKHEVTDEKHKSQLVLRAVKKGCDPSKKWRPKAGS